MDIHRQRCTAGPEPSTHISLFYIPISRGQSLVREVLGAIHFSIEKKKNPVVCFSQRLTHDIYNSNLKRLSETLSPCQMFCCSSPPIFLSLFFCLYVHKRDKKVTKERLCATKSDGCEDNKMKLFGHMFLLICSPSLKLRGLFWNQAFLCKLHSWIR